MNLYYNKIGVYKIKNLRTGDFYIGSSINIGDRWDNHLSKLKNNKHQNIILQNAVNKYGIDSFIFGILEENDKESVREKEQLYLNYYKPKYNINRVVYPTSYTYKHDSDIREKMSKSHKNVPLSQEHRKSISLGNKGKIPKNLADLQRKLRKQIIVWFNDVTPILFNDRFEVIDFFKLHDFNYKYISNLCTKGKRLQGLKIEYA